jgi:hypothetical protein
MAIHKKNKVRPVRRRVGAAFLPGALLAAAGVAGVPALERAAQAQLQLGQIQGRVTNKDTGKPLPGVTIVVSGPALQGDQTEVTDGNGKYQITQLPSGDNYVVRFYFNDVVVERPGVRIAQSKSLTISLDMPTHKGERDVYVVRERAPVIDTASANTGVEINQEILQNTAVRGRTYESALSLAPGSADVSPRGQAGGDVGVSFGGSTGNENAIVIDGLNTTDLNSGVIATQLHQYFIKEFQVITGGYQAEYGRATGGVVSIVTKSGSNEFHGGVFGSWAPWQATPQTVARLGEALATRSRMLQQYDFGFELGGPIVKDRVWFYAGFAPTFTVNRTERAIRAQTPSTMVGTNGMFLAERDTGYQPPGYLSSPELSRGLDVLALRTTEVGAPQQIDETQRIYNWIVKLQFNINPDHNITLGYIGAPEFNNEYNGLRNDVNAVHRDRDSQIHDGTFHYLGKLFDRKLQVDVIYGYHYQGRSDTPYAVDKQLIQYRAPASNPYSLSDFEPSPDCQRQRDGAGKVTFNPCPITTYQYGGYGQYIPHQVLQRHAIQASGTLFLKAGGTHAVKLGFDFEDNLSDNTRMYTGTDFDPNDRFAGHLNYQTDGSGQLLRINRGFGLPRDKDFFGTPGVTPCGMATDVWCYNYFRAVTETRNYSLYLRDSWAIDIGKLKGLTINAGLRWEAQEIAGADGTKQISIYDQLSPRVGLAWDPRARGRAKLYANYGRFYETVPLDINDRSFSGEGFLVGKAYVGDCNRRPLLPGGQPVQVPEVGAGAPCTLANPRVSGGGVYAPVAPAIKGQHQDEVVVGGQVDVGLDIVLGAYYTYRSLGNIIEDLSVNGGDTFFIANPGAQPDPKVAAELDADAQRKQAMVDSTPMPDPKAANYAAQQAAFKQLSDDAKAAKNRADVYKAVSLFPKAQREYHAVTFTINKRLSNRFSILANYTYSRLWGNFPGPFNPYTNQLDPNISSQFDLINLTVNRNGPLNNDRPHNFKATGFYQQPVAGGRGTITASLTFTALSGRPIQTLGQDVVYGARQTFILPSGSAGRTPTITQLDLHLGYEHLLTDKIKLNVYGDVINVANQREVVNVDDEYTFSNVNPIVYGKPEDLRKLRATDGTALVLNSNYGQPTAYQAPLYLRFGARLYF